MRIIEMGDHDVGGCAGAINIGNVCIERGLTEWKLDAAEPRDTARGLRLFKTLR